MSDTNVIFNNSNNDDLNDDLDFSLTNEGDKNKDDANHDDFGFISVGDDDNREDGQKDFEAETKPEESVKDKDQGPSGEVLISESKLKIVEKLLDNIKENQEKIHQLLFGALSKEDEEKISIAQAGDDNFVDIASLKQDKDDGGRIIEGVFDGENMIGPDGKQYSVPANYASKSKLVEGDILKLTITPNGTFVYKQIGPIERIRVVGILDKDDDGRFVVYANDKKWNVLTASVTYYRGQVGDEIVILIPKTGESKWAAVENIVRNVSR